MPTRHWLMKSEPEAYSIDDLARDRATSWNGVRNYQARNFMRDDMTIGDLVLFYHSGGGESGGPGGPGVAGIARVSRAAHPDLTALDPKSAGHDPKATRENPIWVMVDIEFVEQFNQVVPLKTLRARNDLDGLALLQRGQRLSVQPMSAVHFKIIHHLGRAGG